MIYTINNKHSDVNGNFTLLPSDLGLADLVHVHVVADVNQLTSALENKANIDHTHQAMKSIQAGSGSVLTGEVGLAANDASIALSDDTVSLSASIDVDVDLNTAPSVVNYQMGRPVYFFSHDTWQTLVDVRKGNGYSLATVTDELALFAFTSNIVRSLVDIFTYENGVVTKVAVVKNEADVEFYPPPAFNKIMMTTSLDTAVATRLVEGDQYPTPVLNVEENTFEVTVTPFPSNSRWYLECDKFNIPKTIYTGKQIVTVEVPELDIGTHLCSLYAKPYNESRPSTIWGYNDAAPCIKFFRIVQAPSTLSPVYHWPLDNTTTEIINNLEGVFYGEEGEQPVYSIDAVRGSSFQSPATYSTFPAQTGVITPGVEMNIATNGCSISLFVKRVSQGRDSNIIFGWIGAPGESATGNLYLYIQYGTLSANMMGTVINTGPPYVSNTEFCHCCMTVSKPLTEADGYTADQLTKAWYFRVKVYLNGKQTGTSVITIWKEWEARLTGWGGANHLFQIGYQYSKTQNAHRFDEVKIFDKELVLEEIQTEAAMAGYTFDEEETPTTTPSKLVDEPRLREARPDDITSIPITADLKVFVIDKSTIAVGGNFESFYNTRLRTEYPTTLRNMEQNYRNGHQAQWKHEFYYQHSMYELQTDYEPLILDRYDDTDHFKVNGNATTWMGSWSNASGAWEIEDVFDQTRRYLVSAANITHFAYLDIGFDMVEGTEYTVTDADGNTVTFTYDKSSPSWAIKVNQEGYTADSSAKVAYLGAWLGSYGKYTITPTSFEVVDESGTVVLTGTPVLRDVVDQAYTISANRKITGETVYEMNFSSITTPGTYRIHIPGVGYSWPFSIGNKITEKLFYTHARGMYHQRSGIAKVAPFTQWPMAKSQDITYEAPFPGEDKNLDGFKDNVGNWVSLTAFNIIAYRIRKIAHRDVYGGWWDAADWDRRDYHLACVRSMSSAYLMYPSKFTDNQLDLPESGDGIPDILSEAMWGMDVWRRCQRENGGVGLWIESSGHPNNKDAVKDTRPFCMAEPTAYSSLHYALTAAQLSRALQSAGAYKQADMYADSAIRAFNWGVNNLAHIECTLNSIDYTFDEPDSKVSDRTWLRYRKQIMFWAAGQMYLLTKDLQYTKYLTDEYWNEYKAVFDVDDSFFKNVFWELAETDLTPYSTYMRQWIISRADRWIGYQEQYAYRDMSFPPGNNYAAAVAWGNCHPNARGQLYAVAYHLTGDEKYRTAIQHGVNWLTGCNALGRTLTTGVGKVSPVRILSKIDQLLRESTGYHDPVPGITCFTYGTNCLVSEAVNNTYLLSKSARSDSNYTGCNINLMPGKLRSSVSTGAGPIAVYMRDNLPMWRSYVPLQDYAVSMNEFTVSETMGGNLLLLAPLLEDAWTPESDWKARTPVPDPKQLEGYVFLP